MYVETRLIKAYDKGVEHVTEQVIGRVTSDAPRKRLGSVRIESVDKNGVVTYLWRHYATRTSGTMKNIDRQAVIGHVVDLSAA